MAKAASESKVRLDEIKVDFWKTNPHLCEISQTAGIEYSFMSSEADGFKQCHQWIKCRDFLHDALRSHISGKADEIYGFKYDPKVNPPLDLKKMRMLIKHTKSGTVDTREVMDASLAALHMVEKTGGIELSKLYKVNGHDNMYLFEGAEDWMESTFMISLYTLLIRLGAQKMSFKDKEEFDKKIDELSKSNKSDNDINYLKTVSPFIHRIVEKRKALVYVKKDKMLFEGKGIGTFHGYTGVVSLCNQLQKGASSHGVEDLKALADIVAGTKPAEEKKKVKKA